MATTISEVRRERFSRLAEGMTQAELAETLDLAPSYVWQMLNGKRNIGNKTARKIEQRLGLPTGHLDGLNTNSAGTSKDDPGLYAQGSATLRRAKPSPRKVPVISYIQAGSPKEVLDDHEPGNGFEYLSVDDELAEALGPHAFALIVEGLSMADEFKPGDRIIVDPSAALRPGDIVVAKLEADEAATLKKYRARGNDTNGEPIFELVPLNDDYATVVVDADNPAQIIGPVVEHRRKLRR
ncbi:SOS-response transcriptional repressor LexA [Natronocella acetinitrilica]|uniref:SOS-response transcriptional repressor LexA n=1 Tax=Natronocella acetinitrilica TaxID=414046 RepID=A0AAE3G6V2_9GAMM|nr:XRE family transcriptional regulator [Natronocella acetinitrilica]MCP1675478.1 SOS-response transcriptional repressor LexA [Natronocella acetinitrilica]